VYFFHLIGAFQGVKEFRPKYKKGGLVVIYHNDIGDEITDICILTYKKGGLVIIHQHNEIGNKLANIASKAFTLSVVYNEPTINSHGQTAEKAAAGEASPASKYPSTDPNPQAVRRIGETFSSEVSGLAELTT
jgi:hypothetical protein